MQQTPGKVQRIYQLEKNVEKKKKKKKKMKATI